MTASQHRTPPQRPANFARRIFHVVSDTLRSGNTMQNRVDHYS